MLDVHGGQTPKKIGPYCTDNTSNYAIASVNIFNAMSAVRYSIQVEDSKIIMNMNIKRRRGRKLEEFLLIYLNVLLIAALLQVTKPHYSLGISVVFICQ